MQTMKRQTLNSIKWSALSLAAILTIAASLALSSWIAIQVLVLLMHN